MFQRPEWAYVCVQKVASRKFVEKVFAFPCGNCYSKNWRDLMFAARMSGISLRRPKICEKRFSLFASVASIT